jgi:putative intracellular protease/amidase
METSVGETTTGTGCHVVAKRIADRWRAEYEPALAKRDQIMRDWSTDRPIGRHSEQLLANTFDVPAITKSVFGLELPSVAQTPSTVLVMMRDGGSGVGAGGVWASELTVTVAVLLRAGYTVVIGTVHGNPPTILNASTGKAYQDPAFGASVVSDGEIALARAFVDPEHEFGRLMRPENILDLSAYLPEAPLYADVAADAEAMNRYESRLAEGLEQLVARFDAVIWPGGSGGTLNQADDRSQALALAMAAAEKPQVGICNGALLFGQTINPSTNQPLVFGHHVTTHSRGDDPRVGERGNLPDKAARDGIAGGFGSWGFLTDSGGKDPFGPQNYAGVDNPIVLASVSLTNAAGSFELFHSELGTPNSVVIDGKIITARTTTDGDAAALALRYVCEARQSGPKWVTSLNRPAIDLDPNVSHRVRAGRRE